MDDQGDVDAGFFRPSEAEQSDIEAAGERVRYLLAEFERGILTEDDLIASFRELPASTFPNESELAFTWQNGPLAVIQQEETAGRLPMKVATRIIQLLLLESEAQADPDEHETHCQQGS